MQDAAGRIRRDRIRPTERPVLIVTGPLTPAGAIMNVEARKAGPFGEAGVRGIENNLARGRARAIASGVSPQVAIATTVPNADAFVARDRRTSLAGDI